MRSALRPLALPLLAALALQPAACSFDLDAAWPWDAAQDRDRHDGAPHDLRLLEGSLPDRAAAPDAGAHFCSHPALLMHLGFDNSLDDRIGSFKQPTGVASSLSFVNAGKPPAALLRASGDSAFTYHKEHASPLRGTLSVWIRPSYDLAQLNPPPAGGGPTRKLMVIHLLPGAINLLHRAVNDALGRGLALEVWDGKTANISEIWRAMLDDQGTAIAPKGSWTHLVATYDIPGRKLRLYLDGKSPSFALQTTSSLVPGAAVKDVQVGGRSGPAGDASISWDQSWSGAMDELMVFSQVLSAAEIQALHAWQSGGAGCP